MDYSKRVGDNMKRLVLSAIMFLVLTVISFADASPKAILEYFDDPYELTVYDFTGEPLEYFDYGTEILIGFAIETKHTTAELRLLPNGSIIKLGPGTFIKLIELQGLASTTSTRLAQVAGKIRFVAARIQGENYAVETASAVMGVRGTDFIVETGKGGGASIYVEEGVLEVYNPETGSSVMVEEGRIADVHRKVLSIIQDEMEQVRRMVEETRFDRLDPETVPRFDFEEYYNEFEYFKNIEAEEYRKFFTEQDYFADYKEYLHMYREYYEKEIEDFHRKYQRELEAMKQQIQEAEDAYKSEMDDFREYMQQN